MANQTITTSINYDDASISGLLNGETITNNGGSLTINSDVRWAQQAAVMGNITCSAILGGSVLIDGTTVWELPFTASTGNVPTLNALGSNGVTGGTSGATGELLRVWASGVLTPATAGGAMPATGFIKLRSKTGNFQTGEIVTLPNGATVTIANAGRRSWLHIVGAENTQIYAARIAGACSMTGDWYELGTTNGADDQTFQFPVADYCPAIQIETAVGSGVYEWWLYADNRWGTATQFVATDVRGKYFGMDPATGVITIARRATNPCGFKPVSGLKVRVPNLICSSSSSANWNINTFSATVTSRYKGINVTAAAASANYDKICSNWDIFTSSGLNLTITSSASMPLRSITNMGGIVTISDLGIGCLPVVTPTVATTMLVVNGCTLILSDVRVVKRENDFASDVVVNFNTSYCTVNRLQVEMFGSTGSATRNTGVSNAAMSPSRCYDSVFNDTTIIGGGISANTFVGKASFNRITYADRLVGTTQTTGVTLNMFVLATSDGLTFTGPVSWFGGLSNVQPFAALFSISSAARNVVIENVGTSAAPLDCEGNTALLFNIGDCENIIIRRCYLQNTRGNGSLGSFSVTAIDCAIDNCAVDYADLTPITGTRCKWRGTKNSLGNVTAINIGSNVADMFTSATAGRIVFTGNDPSETAPQLVISGGASAGAAGNGTTILPNVNDTATWESPWFHLGHTGLANTTPTITGTNTGNFTLDFQYDTGSGWNNTWLSATGTNLSGIGAINPAIGIKLKLRATTTVANSTNAIGFVSIITNTTSVAQNTLYPFPFDATGTIDNLLTNSQMQIYNEDTSTELFNGVVAGTSTVYSYYDGTQVSAGDTIRIRVAKLGYLPQTLLAIATSTGFSATANQQVDNIYITNNIDGSTITEFLPDYPNVQMDVSDPDGVTTVQRIYAWLRYTETTTQGIQLWFDVITPTDEVNYLIDASKVNLKLDNTSISPVIIAGGRIYKSDGSTIIASISNSIQMDPSRVYSIKASGLSSEETISLAIIKKNTDLIPGIL